MFNFKNSLLAATVLLAIPQIAQAQPITGIYIGAGGGFNFLDSEHIRASSMPVPVGGVHTSYQPGWAALGSVGYGFGNGFRVEVEGNYRTNHLRSNTMISGRSSSSEDKYGAMLNALYDFNTMDVGMDGVGISPYLGLGAGWAHNKWNNTTVQDAGGRIGSFNTKMLKCRLVVTAESAPINANDSMNDLPSRNSRLPSAVYGYFESDSSG